MHSLENCFVGVHWWTREGICAQKTIGTLLVVLIVIEPNNCPVFFKGDGCQSVFTRFACLLLVKDAPVNTSKVQLPTLLLDPVSSLNTSPIDVFTAAIHVMSCGITSTERSADLE